MSIGDGEKDGDGAAAKAKRVRTGCLTCRERHLKCDEGLPSCNNCKKSNRTCKRGVRLNFIDTWVEQPPRIVTRHGTDAWFVEFSDESREIASEYQGGLERYRRYDEEVSRRVHNGQNATYAFATSAPAAPALMHQSLPPIQGILPEPFVDTNQQHPEMTSMYEAQIKPDLTVFQQHPPNSSSTNNTHFSNSGAASTVGQASVASYQTTQTDIQGLESEKREYIDNPEETLFMQVFVEEVGIWMDSMDPLKHFSRLLPFHALSEPMLLNAFLACGARHLTLVNSAYNEEKALHYYDTATRYLLKNLQNPNRDTIICATTAVILNVYEIMSERALQRMNHIAGARALIKECGWNARAQGIGAACFWLNVGLEVLSCLHFNWQVAWDPDEWGLDMDFTREIHNGREEVWTHRMLYIMGKVCNFRATIPRHPESDPRDQQLRAQQRCEEWTRLKALIDAWSDGIPRTMQPMAYVHPNQTSSKSAFPEIWLIKRTAIVARLFFHTAQLLMAQTHPYYGPENYEMMELQRLHSRMVCGIVAHVKDRGVASVAIRSLAHAAEVLTDRREQEEVLQIFERINKETGWRIGFVYKELKEKWRWNEEPSAHQLAQTHTAARQQKEAQDDQKRQLHEQGHTLQPTPQSQHTTPAQKLPAGIPNPMYKQADFNLPQHPYQNFYVAPNNHFGHSQGGGMYYNFQ
ncbi:hypothetical protein M433DRAFT_62435 [Acidomyces richmondensis BFW]|nr:MAG: hypothetical protein FE78DRAFT_140402 [Acidomyces sp. 'richmondensis']KYG47785.1 hypothetical protein M433DRAFT_62435 [Acidomyces richmondensis BFW]